MLKRSIKNHNIWNIYVVLGLLTVFVFAIVWSLSSWDEEYVSRVIAIDDDRAIIMVTKFDQSSLVGQTEVRSVQSNGAVTWSKRFDSVNAVAEMRSLRANSGSELQLIRYKSRDNEQSTLSAIDFTGKVLWSQVLAERSEYYSGKFVVGGDKVWISSLGGVEVRSLKSGQVLWERDLHSSTLLIDEQVAIDQQGAIFGPQASEKKSDMSEKKSDMSEKKSDMKWVKNDGLCLLDQNIIGIKSNYVRNPTELQLEYLNHRQESTRQVKVPWPIKQSYFCHIPRGAICGQFANLDIVSIDCVNDGYTFAYQEDGKLVWTHHWGADRPDYFGGEGELVSVNYRRMMTKFVPIITEVDNKVSLDLDLKNIKPQPGETGFDAGFRSGVKLGKKYQEKGGFKNDYRLDMFNMETGKIQWSRILLQKAESARSIQLIQVGHYYLLQLDLDSNGFIAIFDGATGKQKETIDTRNIERIDSNQVTETVVWLVYKEQLTAIPYAVDILDSQHQDAP